MNCITKENIRNFRVKKQISQKTLAKELGITNVHLSYVEHGKNNISINLENKFNNIKKYKFSKEKQILSIGQKIKNYRTKHNITQTKMAHQLAITNVYLNYIEHDKVSAGETVINNFYNLKNI